MALRFAPTSRRSSPRERPTHAAPDRALVERFQGDLGALIAPDSRIGLAVSGGPDSLALLLLAAQARPGRIEAATVDHGLRPQAADEAAMVAQLCAGGGIPHACLEAEWERPPDSAVQERARAERYRLLARWIEERGLDALVTAHHLDDQAETLLMRLNRGSGVRGLAAMRSKAVAPGSAIPLLRPLLSWRRSELEFICECAGVVPADDPGNRDDRFERVRIRRLIATADALDTEGIARSALNLASADEAIEWATAREWTECVTSADQLLSYRPSAPPEVARRIVSRCVESLASEGDGSPLRGRELDGLMQTLVAGGTSTLRGVLCRGGADWSFHQAPRRRVVDS